MTNKPAARPAGLISYDHETHGRLFVADGISRGTSWATYYRKPSGGLKRFVSPDLKPRPTRAQAQADLDAYATMRDLLPWQLAEDGFSRLEEPAPSMKQTPQPRRKATSTEPKAPFGKAPAAAHKPAPARPPGKPAPDLRRDFARSLRYYREEKGWTQAKLAAALGIDVGTLSRWERGANFPDLPRLYALAALLEVTPAHLVGASLQTIGE